MMKAVVRVMIGALEVGQVSAEVVSEEEAQAFFERCRDIKLTMTNGTNITEATPFANMPWKRKVAQELKAAESAPKNDPGAT